jgi:hypothetical protein
MKTFRVVIVETITTVYLVPAQDADEAEEEAREHNEHGLKRLIDSERADKDITVEVAP